MPLMAPRRLSWLAAHFNGGSAGWEGRGRADPVEFRPSRIDHVFVNDVNDAKYYEVSLSSVFKTSFQFQFSY